MGCGNPSTGTGEGDGRRRNNDSADTLGNRAVDEQENP